MSRSEYSAKARMLWAAYAATPRRPQRMALYNFYRPVARALVRRMASPDDGHPRPIPLEDLRQIALLRLWETIPRVAAAAYDQPAMCMSYIKRRVSGGLIDAARKILGDDRWAYPIPAMEAYDDGVHSCVDSQAASDAKTDAEVLADKRPELRPILEALREGKKLTAAQDEIILRIRLDEARRAD